MVAEEREGLRRIRRLRRWFWGLIAALLPLVWLATEWGESSSAVMALLVIWLAVTVRCASRAAFSQCPRCRNYFHTPPGTPSFWNLLARRCTHCGLPLRSDRVMYPGMT